VIYHVFASAVMYLVFIQFAHTCVHALIALIVWSKCNILLIYTDRALSNSQGVHSVYICDICFITYQVIL
jgi:hypothetical protein